MLNIFINLLLVVHVIVSLLIIVAVLMQRPKNEGLGAAFGAGMTDSLFGAQTTNVLASITRWLGALFFILTLVLSALYARQGREKTGVEQRLQQAPKPVVPTQEDSKPAEANVDSKAPAEAPKAPAEAPKAPAEAPKTPAEAPKASESQGSLLRSEAEVKLSPTPPPTQPTNAPVPAKPEGASR